MPNACKVHNVCYHIRAPDTAKIKEKMLYASSKDAIKKKLDGLSAEIQGTDYDEVEYQTVYDEVSAKGE